MKSQLEDLYRRTGLTKESCFHAGRRLGRHDSLSLWSLTTLAFSLIVVSLITQIYEASEFIIEYSRFINLSITTMSVFALVISVLVQKSNFALRSDRHRLQAMAISDLRISFRHLIERDSTEDDFKEIYEAKSDKYSDILNRNLVHDQIDYLITSTKGIESKYYKLKLFFTEYVGYWAIILVTLALLSGVCIGTYVNSGVVNG